MLTYFMTLSPGAMLCMSALWLAAAGAVAQPLTFARQTETVPIAGVDASVDIYRPGAGPSLGVAIVAHGFTRSRVRHKDLGQALAQAGVTAVIPDLPNVVDLWGNGDAIMELAQKLEAGEFGTLHAERSHLVLIGTSAGGLATVLAAARMPGLAGWIGLDPVDRTGSGSDAAARLDAPAVVLLGSASTCNLFSSGRGIARALPHLLHMTAFKEATHCDFEDPTNNFCRALCGGSSSEMKVRIRDETVRATLEMLAIATAKSDRMLPAAVPGAPDAPAPPAPPAPDTVPDVAGTPEPSDPRE